MVNSANKMADKEYSEDGVFFRAPNTGCSNLTVTLRNITWEMENIFEKEVPTFWSKNYPA